MPRFWWADKGAGRRGGRAPCAGLVEGGQHQDDARASCSCPASARCWTSANRRICSAPSSQEKCPREQGGRGGRMGARRPESPERVLGTLRDRDWPRSARTGRACGARSTSGSGAEIDRMETDPARAAEIGRAPCAKAWSRTTRCRPGCGTCGRACGIATGGRRKRDPNGHTLSAVDRSVRWRTSVSSCSTPTRGHPGQAAGRGRNRSSSGRAAVRARAIPIRPSSPT